MISKNIHSDVKLNKIKELASQNGVIYQFVAKEKFQPYAQYNHQGVIAQISPVKYLDLDEFLEDEFGMTLQDLAKETGVEEGDLDDYFKFNFGLTNTESRGELS